MKKVLLLSSFLALGASATFATPACSTQTDLSTISSYSCEIGDKIFSGFSVSGATAGDSLSFGGGGTLYTLHFDTNGTAITSNFTLDFTVAVDTLSQPQNFISQVQDQMFTANAAGGDSLPNPSTATVTHTPGGTVNLSATQTSGQDQTNSAKMFTQTEGVQFQYFANSGGELSFANFAISQVTAPEPVSMSLTGLGLLGLGFFGRRRLKA